VDKVFITKELARFNVTTAALAELRTKYLPLKVTSITDMAGYEQCKIAHQIVKKLRTSIDPKRKEIKEDALNFSRQVDTEAKRIVASIFEVEEYLLSQRKIVEDEKLRVKEEKEQAERDREEKITAEEERLKQQKEEQDRREQEQAEEADRLEREKKDFDDEKERQEQEEKERPERERREREDREQAEREETARREARQPDVDKLKLLAKKLEEIKLPKVKSIEAQTVLSATSAALGDICKKLKTGL